jgi:hypothetical protein
VKCKLVPATGYYCEIYIKTGTLPKGQDEKLGNYSAVNTNELDYIYKIKLIKNTAVDKNLIENIYRC